MTTRRSLRAAPEPLDAENEPALLPAGKQAPSTKKMGKPRAAFIDLTNAIEKGLAGGKKGITKLGVKKGRVHRAPESSGPSQQPAPPPRLALKPRAGVKRTATADADGAAKKARKLRSIPTLADLTSVTVDVTRLALPSSSSSGSLESSETTFETPPQGNTPTAERQSELVDRLNAENELRRSALPDGVLDFDAESAGDIFAVPEYVADVFRYYRQRESRVAVTAYLETKQPDLTEMMRAILVDWMVEVQESFELNHETLYMAVQLVDVYLGHVVVSRETLQLVGATAIFVACKFDERLPPPLDDFLYICEDAYARREVIFTEMKMLRTVNFDLGLPVSYRFLRRYARCCKLSIEVLTLARYILELSLMEYQFVTVAGSRMAAAALTLAVLMRSPDQFAAIRRTVEHFSEYKTEEFKDVVHKLNDMLRKEASPHLKTIRAKYSHKVFHQVAKIAVLESVPAL
ncbi:G2/mitotic-specific cyclin-B3-like [Pollicipes pollicipes]|uniref:G2/mitotic-specific cyclin-B3-like n=1 Tax=Pollicipes pollicipes TaxID=41117 RepID=UPI0018853D77|nr:G2/mitotic-specific cyclin-B3-like [Pollicipes pollicipes]